VDQQIVIQTLHVFRENSDYCVFDLETTGKNATATARYPTAAKVLQIAARRYRYNHVDRSVKLLAQLNVLLNDPTIEQIDPFLTNEVHHIGMPQIRDAAMAAKFGTEHMSDPAMAAEYRAELVDPRTGWSRFAKLLSGAVAVGHNIDNFDIPFAQYDSARWGLEMPFLTFEGEPLPVGYNPKKTAIHSIDTVKVSRLLWHRDNRGIGKAGYKLRSLANMLHIKTDPALDHNALGDINTNWLLFMAMLPYLRSYQQRFLPPSGSPPDQYRRMLPGLRPSIPTAAEYATARAARDVAALERAARSAEGLDEPVLVEDEGGIEAV
jgi:DNA polymerase III epsilon subunit-like protein